MTTILNPPRRSRLPTLKRPRQLTMAALLSPPRRSPLPTLKRPRRVTVATFLSLPQRSQLQTSQRLPRVTVYRIRVRSRPTTARRHPRPAPHSTPQHAPQLRMPIPWGRGGPRSIPTRSHRPRLRHPVPRYVTPPRPLLRTQLQAQLQTRATRVDQRLRRRNRLPCARGHQRPPGEFQRTMRCLTSYTGTGTYTPSTTSRTIRRLRVRSSGTYGIILTKLPRT